MSARTPVMPPLTSRQVEVAQLLSDGHSPEEVAVVLGIKAITVRYHITEATRNIPGDLPPRQRLVAWVRGAGLEVLDRPAGAALRCAMRLAKKRRKN